MNPMKTGFPIKFARCVRGAAERQKSPNGRRVNQSWPSRCHRSSASRISMSIETAKQCALIDSPVSASARYLARLSSRRPSLMNIRLDRKTEQSVSGGRLFTTSIFHLMATNAGLWRDQVQQPAVIIGFAIVSALTSRFRQPVRAASVCQRVPLSIKKKARCSNLPESA